MNKAIDIKLIEKNLIKNIKWIEEPFPHAVIDNFLPQDLFKQISSKTNDITELKKAANYFQSHAELKKKVFSMNELNSKLKIPIEILGSKKICGIFKKYFKNFRISSLLEQPALGGYFPFHSMADKGLLGSHVDHSHSNDNKLHVANAIYYVSPEWDSKWGGETILFSNNGLKPLKYITPKPNRLVLFIHSSLSFHGVNLINCPAPIKRNTYYMDYYLDNATVDKDSMSKFNKLRYFNHHTTFIPFFPLGVSSFRFKNIFEMNSLVYCYVLIRYLINKIFT